MDIENKVALITGGASGLGFASAQKLIAAGAKIMVMDLNEDNAKKACSELEGETDYAHLDSSNPMPGLEITEGEVPDDMIKWKKKGTELYQNLPKECRELMKECNPLSKLEKNRKEKQKITFETWKKTQ